MTVKGREPAATSTISGDPTTPANSTAAILHVAVEGGTPSTQTFVLPFGPDGVIRFRSGDLVTLTPLSWRFETDVFVRSDGEPLSDHDALAVRFGWAVAGR